MSPNTDSNLLQESVSLSIPQKQGEKAIQLLGKLKLLNRKLAPQVIDDQLHVPLARAPKAQEQELLERVLGKQNLLREEFRSRLEPVGSLEKVLTQQLPSSIIRLVSKSFDIIGDIAIIARQRLQHLRLSVAGRQLPAHGGVQFSSVLFELGNCLQQRRRGLGCPDLDGHADTLRIH